MKPRSRCSSVINGAPLLLVVVVCFGLSPVARSQSSDSCSTPASLAAGVSKLIPFDTSNLTCFDAWSSENFIVRVRSVHCHLLSIMIASFV